jgi:hypothetical protein
MKGKRRVMASLGRSLTRPHEGADEEKCHPNVLDW